MEATTSTARTVAPRPYWIFMVIACGFLAFEQGTQAVIPPPDDGYAGGNTAEGQSALLDLNFSDDGNPADKAVVDGNLFRHHGNPFNHDTSDAIEQNGDCGGLGDNITTPIDIRLNNVFGVDPTMELANCDFAGDGQQDQFMATGVTWWTFSQITFSVALSKHDAAEIIGVTTRRHRC